MRNILDLVTFLFGSLFTVEGFDPYSISELGEQLIFQWQIRKRMKVSWSLCFQRLPREERFYRHQTSSPALANFPSGPAGRAARGPPPPSPRPPGSTYPSLSHNPAPRSARSASLAVASSPGTRLAEHKCRHWGRSPWSLTSG